MAKQSRLVNHTDLYTFVNIQLTEWLRYITLWKDEREHFTM